MTNVDITDTYVNINTPLLHYSWDFKSTRFLLYAMAMSKILDYRNERK